MRTDRSFQLEPCRVQAAVAATRLAALLAAILMAAVGCAPEPDSAGSTRLRIAVSILPQEYFVERIGGEFVNVAVVVPPGQSPATYEPTARQMVDVSRADLLLTIGVPFEKRLVKKITEVCPDLEVVDTRAGVPLRRIDAHRGHDHGEEDLGAEDPHVWLDPLLVKIQCRTITEALARRDPERRVVYERNLAALEAELDRLHADITRMLEAHRGRTFYVFHPAFGYFADRYGLTQKAVEVEGKEPTARQLVELVDEARRDRVSVILVQAQFSAESAGKVAEAIGATVVTVDPLRRDYEASLKALAAAIAGAVNT